MTSGIDYRESLITKGRLHNAAKLADETRKDEMLKAIRLATNLFTFIDINKDNKFRYEATEYDRPKPVLLPCDKSENKAPSEVEEPCFISVLPAEDKTIDYSKKSELAEFCRKFVGERGYLTRTEFEQKSKLYQLDQFGGFEYFDIRLPMRDKNENFVLAPSDEKISYEEIFTSLADLYKYIEGFEREAGFEKMQKQMKEAVERQNKKPLEQPDNLPEN